MFVFLDETGADHRHTSRQYGYSIRGKQTVEQQLLVRGNHVFGLALISVEDLLDVKTINETADGDCFYDFVQKYVIPHLIPFNGHSPHSILIMDNCATHHIQEIATMNED